MQQAKEESRTEGTQKVHTHCQNQEYFQIFMFPVGMRVLLCDLVHCYVKYVESYVQ